MIEELLPHISGGRNFRTKLEKQIQELIKVLIPNIKSTLLALHFIRLISVLFFLFPVLMFITTAKLVYFAHKKNQMLLSKTNLRV